MEDQRVKRWVCSSCSATHTDAVEQCCCMNEYDEKPEAMKAEHKAYLDDIVGSQRQEWIWVAIASHLRRPFPELSEAQAMAIVREYCENKELCTPADIIEVRWTKVCVNCKSDFSPQCDDEALCGCCLESGITEGSLSVIERDKI